LIHRFGADDHAADERFTQNPRECNLCHGHLAKCLYCRRRSSCPDTIPIHTSRFGRVSDSARRSPVIQVLVEKGTPKLTMNRCQPFLPLIALRLHIS
jgi:hypothetical protein